VNGFAAGWTGYVSTPLWLEGVPKTDVDASTLEFSLS